MKLMTISKTLTLALSLLVFMSCASFGQSKANKKQDKFLKKELKEKPIKLARKEAKRLSKEGYYVVTATLPMDKQLERAYMRQLEEDENGYARYLTASQESVAETKIAAKNQALEAAKLDLAGQIATNVVGLVENSFANKQLNMEEAASLTKTVTGSKNIIAQKLGRVIILFEAYKQDKALGKNKNIGYTCLIAYNQETAWDTVKQTIREELEDEADDIHKKLDQILDF